MSTNCVRVVEYKNADNEWIRCSKVSDNFHGFDRWKNEYADRGFPEDCTVTDSEHMDTIGENLMDIAWGKSYITLEELQKWIDKEFEEAGKYLYREMANSQFGYILQKLDGNEPTPKDEVITDEEFKQTFDECLDWFTPLEDEMTAACTAVRLKLEQNYFPLEKVRIVYWFE